MKTFTYHQASGILADESGIQIAVGWAGNHDGKNNPDAEQTRCIGPLPRGTYRVEPWEAMHPHLGPDVAALTQIAGDTFGRGDFFIHGPSVASSNYGQESKGCIVLPRPSRIQVMNLKPDQIEVVV